MNSNKEPTNSTADTKKKSYFWPIILIIGPTILIFLAILGYGVANFVATGEASGVCETNVSDRECTDDNLSNGAKAINIALFIIATAGFLSEIPCLIIGIVLISKYTAYNKNLATQQQK